MRTMNTVLRLAALMLFFVTAASSAATPSDFKALDAYLQTELERAGIPGAALVVVSDKKIVHLQGYGVRGPGGAPPDADTVFQIGSNSKSFTALAIMQLVEAGKLALDAPVQRYLPWFRVADADLSAQITLRHLLYQTSGFPHLEGQLDFANADAGADAVERRVRRLAGVRLASPPGQKFAYSNINYVVLGGVIEAVTGTSYAAYMKAHVWEPLAMHRTAAGFTAAQQDDMATGYRFWLGKAVPSNAGSVPYPATLLASGYLTSTARDMGAYLLANLGAAPHIVSTTGLQELHRKGANTGKRYGYAMGWSTDSEQPHMASHEGQTAQYTSAMAIDTQQGWGYALLLNASDALRGPVILDLSPQVASYLRGMAPLALNAKRTWPSALIALVSLSVTLCAIGIWLLRRRPSAPPARPRQWLLKALLPLVAGLSLATVLLAWIPHMAGLNLSGLLLFAPDAGVLLVINAVLALCLGALPGLRYVLMHASTTPPSSAV